MSLTSSAKVLTKSINFGYAYGFMPFYWNKKETKFTYNPSWTRSCFLYFHILFSILYMVYGFGKGLFGDWNSELTLEQRMHVIYSSIGVSLATSISYFGTVKHFDLLHKLVESSFNITRKYNDKGRIGDKEQNKKEKDGLQTLFRTIQFVTFFAALTSGIKALREPAHPIHWSSIIQNPKQLWFGFRLMLVYAQFHVIGFGCYNLGVHFMLNITLISTMFPIIKHLNAEKANRCDLERKANLFRTLQVMSNVLVNAIGSTTLCYQLTALVLTTWNLVQAVLYHSPRAILLFILISFCWPKFLDFSIKLEEKTENILDRWSLKHIENIHYITKFRRSCKTIKIPVANFFHIDRKLKLTTGSIIFESFINLLLLLS